MYDDDYTEDDRYDWDRSDARQYCQHGTFIGSWAGPDILCGWCEDGVSAAEMRSILAARRDREQRERAERLTALCDSVAEGMATAGAPYDAKLATFITGYVWNESAGLDA